MLWTLRNILLAIRISKIHVSILNLLFTKKMLMISNVGLNWKPFISLWNSRSVFALPVLVLNSTTCAVLWRSKQGKIDFDSLQCLLNFPEEISTSFICRCFFPCTAYAYEDYWTERDLLIQKLSFNKMLCRRAHYTDLITR